MTDYSEQQLIGALRKADAAGDVAAAQAIARRIQTMRTAAPKADFSAVRSTKATTETGPPPRSTLQEAGRSLGLGARGMIRGAGDIVGIAADPFIQGANALGANQATMRQGADRLADTLGLPSPETPTERVSSGITSALTGGGGLIGLGRGMAAQGPGIVRDVGRTLSAMPRTQLASLVGGSGASETTREMGGSPGAQMTAGLIGGLGPAVALTSGQAGIRGLVRGGSAGREQFARNVEDFRATGAQPSVGQAAANYRTRGIESLLAGGPTSSGVMSRFATQQAEDIGTGLQQQASRLSRNPSAEKAGEAVQSGIESFKGNVGAQRKALYWLADKRISPNTGTPMENTVQALAELSTPNPGAVATTGRMVNPRMKQMLGDLRSDLRANGGQIPYESLRKIRTEVGEQMRDFSMTPDTPARQLSALYSALSRDMEAVASKFGPDALQAAKRANKYTKLSSDRLERLQRVVDKDGGGEAVYRAVMSGSKDGGTTLRRVMSSVPLDDQKALTAAVIRRMGMARSGAQDAAGDVFSADTFLTKWNDVSHEARRALFNRHGPQFSRDMARIARVADNIKQGSKVFANPSGSANKGAAYVYAGSLLTGMAAAPVVGPLPLISTAMAGISAHAAARIMTNPKVVSWLAQSTELPLSSLPQQLVVLDRIAKEDEDAAELAAAIRSQGQQPPQ